MTRASISARNAALVGVVALCSYLIADWRGAVVGAASGALLLGSERPGRLIVGVGAVLLLSFAGISSLTEAPVDPSVSFTADRPNAAAAARMSAILVVAGLVVEIDRARSEPRTDTEESTGQ